ncbi:hypothetical protein CerSpe_261690 [Prunus speciosa]
MAALHTKLFCLLPLLFIINGINAQLVHFPQFPVPFGNPFHVPDRFWGHQRGAAWGDPDAAVGVDPDAAVGGDPEAAAVGGDPEAAAVGGDPDATAAEAGLINVAKPGKAPDMIPKADNKPNPVKAVLDAPAQPDFPTQYVGAWEVVKLDAGVSAMHLNLLPNNKLMMYDASAFHISNIKLPRGECLPFKDDKGVQQTDCWSHGVEYDVETNDVRPLKITTDPWCSSGGLTADGNFISTGGWMDGTRSVRYFDLCKNCDYRDLPNALAEARWYATQVTLPDGRFFLAGGRKSYSFEYVPPEGQVNKQAIFFPLLDETTDLDENNLYPFVHLSTDGNLFILANSRSVLLSTQTNTVIKEFPVLKGGSRNYPASGMSALLPIDLSVPNNAPLIPAEVIVCGGAKPEAYGLAGKGNFLPALQDCGRLRITDPNPQWATELMPSARVMGDMLNLPTGDLLIINGAQQGASAWFLAEQPNFTPVVYSPNNKAGARFRNLVPTQIARMYHSTAALLPNGKILVAGSNTNPGYDYKAKYPTELRVEHFSPPYLDPALAAHRPTVMAENSDAKLKYGQLFSLQLQLQDNPVGKADIKVTMYSPPFTTHGYSMNQRLLVLGKNELTEAGPGVYKLQVVAPATNVLAPPGYYLVFVVYRGVPSVGHWVQILN